MSRRKSNSLPYLEAGTINLHKKMHIGHLSRWGWGWRWGQKDMHYPGQWFRSSDPAGSLHKRRSFWRFPAGSGRKRHRKMETVFRPESHRRRKPGILESSLHRIVSGNDMDPSRKQTEIQRFPPESDRNTSYCSSRSDYKTPFPRIRSAKNQYCLGDTTTNKKSILKISNRLSHLK